MVQIPAIVEDKDLLPAYAHTDDAGADLRSSEDGVIKAGQRGLVPTGVRVDIPAGYVGLIHPRSGLALNHGITVLNAPGTIDAGYQGELKVILFNSSDTDFNYQRYDRVAQIVFQKVEKASFGVKEFSGASLRSSNGFGSTGV